MFEPSSWIRSIDWKTIQYKFYPRTRDQQLIFVSLLFALLISVVLPIAAIYIFSFAEVYPLRGGFNFTLEHYETFLQEDWGVLRSVLINSFLYAGGATVFSMLIGGVIAVALVKYIDSTFLQLLMVLPYGLPGIAALTGWILLLGQAGLLTGLYKSLFDVTSAPWDLYTLWGMVFVEGLHVAPVAFLLMLPAIRAIPAEMDEASFTAGGNRFETLKNIIIPLVWPSLFSTAIFLFIRTIATVTTPAILGIPSQIFTFGSAIPFLWLTGTAELNYSKALAAAVILTLITAAFILVYLRIQAKEGRYITVSGRGGSEPSKYHSGPLTRYSVYGAISLYILVAGIIPFAAVIWQSLLPPAVLGLVPDISLFTLANYVGLFNESIRGVVVWWRPLRNTILLGITVPTSGMLIALLIAYSNQSVNMPLSKLLSFLASIPLAIPGIARSMGFLATLIYTPLYGTFWILFVAFHSFAIPVGMRYASPALTRISAENAEASILSGANVIRTFKNITLPLVGDDYVAGWMHLFVGIIRNVSIPVLLAASGSEVVAVELLFALQNAYFKVAATMAVILTLLSLVPYMFLQYRRVYDKKVIRVEEGP